MRQDLSQGCAFHIWHLSDCEKNTDFFSLEFIQVHPFMFSHLCELIFFSKAEIMGSCGELLEM